MELCHLPLIFTTMLFLYMSISYACIISSELMLCQFEEDKCMQRIQLGILYAEYFVLIFLLITNYHHIIMTHIWYTNGYVKLKWILLQLTCMKCTKLWLVAVAGKQIEYCMQTEERIPQRFRFDDGFVDYSQSQVTTKKPKYYIYRRLRIAIDRVRKYSVSRTEKREQQRLNCETILYFITKSCGLCGSGALNDVL